MHDVELTSLIRAARPRPRPGFATCATAAALRARSPAAARVAVAVALAAAFAAIVATREPAYRWRLADRWVPDGTRITLAGGRTTALALGDARLDLVGAIGTIDDSAFALDSGLARMTGAAAITTGSIRVVGDSDARADVSLVERKDDAMWTRTASFALAATAGTVVLVTVDRGAVRVSTPTAGAITLAAGKSATVDGQAGAIVVRETRPSRAIIPPPALVASDEPCDHDKCQHDDTEDAGKRFTVPIERAPSMGPPNAKVTIVEFIDFECPFCERAIGTVEDLVGLYPKDLRVIVKNLPLTKMHPHARDAAIAAVAAGAQGKYWEMHEMLFANDEKLDAASLEGYAQHLGLDLARFRADIADPRTAAIVDDDVRDAQQIDIRGVPSFLINGRLVVGALPLEALRKIVDEQLTH